MYAYLVLIGRVGDNTRWAPIVESIDRVYVTREARVEYGFLLIYNFEPAGRSLRMIFSLILFG